MMFIRRDIGWKEIDEEFTRWEWCTPWFAVMLHRMRAPIKHDRYHDHPWNFITFVLRGGYWETMPNGKDVWRGPGSLLKRSAEFKHKTTTYDKTSWSICITGPRFRQWKGDLI